MPRKNLVSNIWEYFRSFHYLYAKIISFAHECATVPIDQMFADYCQLQWQG